MKTDCCWRIFHRCIWAVFALALTSAIARADNRIVANLEPTREHPRKSEGAFIPLKSGRIVFYYTEFHGGRGDASPAHIVSIFSDDRGATWSSEPEVVIKNAGAQNVMSTSVLRLASGKIALFYLIKNGLHDCRPYMQISDDETKTWSKPELVIQAPGYFVLNNDRVIQLRSGRLIAPVAFHRRKGPSTTDLKSSFDLRAIALWYLSDDEGKTWSEADTWWALPVATRTGMQEPGVVELADGTLFSWARTDQLSQYASRSTNAGKSWSAPVPTELRSPVSPASIKRLPGSSDLLAVYNDHSGKFPHPDPLKRTPLIVAISQDGGKTWPLRKSIEDDPEGWYCYTAIEFVDDSVLLSYCAGDVKVGRVSRTRIRKISLDWIKE